MKAKSRTNCTIFLLTIATLLSSCEGFKILTLYNRTGQEITVQTKPELPVFKRTSLANTVDILADTKEYKIPVDSSLTLLATFGPLLFNARIKENDLSTDYVKIITPTDIIIANTRAEILQLTKSDKTKYKKGNDKTFAIDDNKNIEAIIIRQ